MRGVPVRGRWIPLSPARRMVSDFLWLGRRAPTISVRRVVNIAPLIAARRAAPIPWTAIFLKAHALVLEEAPELRRNYVALPWPHFYETTTSVGFIMIERAFDGDKGLFPVQIKEPEERTLTDMAERVRHAASAPLAELPRWRFILRIARMPLVLRRALWLLAFNIGTLRMRYFASFGVSAVGLRGGQPNHIISPLTSLISYGAFAANGDVELLISADHRAVDGAAIHDALAAIEDKLNGPILAELKALAADGAFAAKD